MRNVIDSWKQRARHLKHDTYALYLAYRDPRVPWAAKAFAALVVAYAFSPLDLIPDFIPILGYVDDLVLVPLGIALALKMIPAQVLDESRVRAEEMLGEDRPRNWVAGGIILAIWLLLAALAIALTVHLLRK
jgi:uncharacterized membrane protein YkvA (DUF1232 family)